MPPINVPGCADAWSELHQKFGKLKLSDDLAPAAKYADEEFPVTELMALYWHFAPNIQGSAALEILNILEGFDLKAMGCNSAETLHAMIEAKKLAWADRAKFYADPEFATIPLAQLISKQYAAERRKLIDPNHAAKT